MDSLYKKYIDIWKARLQDYSLSKKERESLQKRIDTDSMGQEYYIPTQVRSMPMGISKTLSIPIDYQYDSTLTITKNAELSLKAWFKLKNHLEKTYLKGTYSLAACSQTAYVYSQEFVVEI